MPIAFVIGGAECVWDDVEVAHKLVVPDAYFVTNSMLVHWNDRIDYGIALHEEKIAGWKKDRLALGKEWNFEVWSWKPLPGLVDHVSTDWAGSAGLFGVKIALQEGFEWIILCGVPMEIKGGHFIRKMAWMDATVFRGNWKRRLKTIYPFTRSMSGWTKEALGEPTQEWLMKRSNSANA